MADRHGGRGKSRHPGSRSLKARLRTLEALGPFVAMAWRISPIMTTGALVVRIVTALQPIAALFIGKLIIDDVVRLTQMADKPQTLDAWLASGELTTLSLLIAAELGIAVAGNVLGRAGGLLEICSRIRCPTS